MLVVIATLAATGCTLLYKPNRDAIVQGLDGGVDAGPDASDSGPGDGGPDGGHVCVPSPEECEDTQQLDEDCDGESNCFDFDCRGNATCCRPGMLLSRCPASGADFIALPAASASDIVFSDFDCTGTSRITEFGPTGRTRALVTPTCQRITFGMRLAISFVITRDCLGATCDYAALSFGPVRTLVDGEPFASELRIMLSSDGSMSVDRAGTPIGDLTWGPGEVDLGERVDVQVDLEPGPDASGQDVLFATVEVTRDGLGVDLLERTAVAPLAALECIDPGGGPADVGLYVAIEGAGDDVEVIGDLGRTENQCSNPSQFLPDANSVHTADVEACAVGGIGAPALVNYCRSSCDGGAQIQWDLWVDASDTPRIEESFRYVDYGVCGFAWPSPLLPTEPWLPRAGGGFLLGDSPSAREPTLLAVSDDGSGTRVSKLFYAYARRTAPDTEVYEIVGGTVETRALAMPTPFAAALLTPDRTSDCVSVRDPLLVADYATATAGGHRVEGAWLLFTCEHEGGDPDSIGVAHFDGADELTLETGSVRTDVLMAEPETYSDRGVFAPEGFSAPSADGQLTVRLWYLARDGTGQVRLAHAQGRALTLGTFPAIEPYPANPILSADSRVLDCASGCTITGASVTPSIVAQGDWQFVISRSRLTGGGTVHELVPLLQFAPND